VLLHYHIGRIVLGSMCVGVSVWVMMDILMSEKCWAHKKCSKIASDIKFVFYSSANPTRFTCAGFEI